MRNTRVLGTIHQTDRQFHLQAASGNPSNRKAATGAIFLMTLKNSPKRKNLREEDVLSVVVLWGFQFVREWKAWWLIHPQ